MFIMPLIPAINASRKGLYSLLIAAWRLPHKDRWGGDERIGFFIYNSSKKQAAANEHHRSCLFNIS